MGRMMMETTTATIEDLMKWHEEHGVALVIEDGEVTDVVIEK